MFSNVRVVGTAAGTSSTGLIAGARAAASAATAAAVFPAASASARAVRAYAAGTEQDVVIIGGGPGGYVAAIKAAQLGMNVTCVEKRGALGGTCLNVGCIPSKALLHTTHLYELTKGYFGDHGIEVDNPRMDIGRMQEAKVEAVNGLTSGIEGLFKRAGVTYAKGSGEITSPNEVTVTLNEGGTEKIATKNIVIATGSEVTPLPFLPIDEKRVLSSTGALALDHVPEKMVVIGGGVIGLEMGSVWSRLGSKVTVVEYQPGIGGGLDGEVAKGFQRILKKQGFDFKLSTGVVGADVTDSGVALHVEGAKNKKQETLEADAVLVSIGRRPHVEGLGLENVGIPQDKAGRVEVNDNFQTSVPSIYAIGDVIRGPMLAHKAEEEGIAIAEHLNGDAWSMHYNAIPGVIYTAPEVAWVGKTEEELKAEGIKYKKGVFPFLANSRAKTNAETDGFVKVLASAEDDQLYGVWIINNNAGELIAPAVVGLTWGASSEDLARTCWAHPTLSEAVKEACMATFDKAIHM